MIDLSRKTVYLEKISNLLEQIEKNTRKTEKKVRKDSSFVGGSAEIMHIFNELCVPPLKEATPNKLIIEKCNARCEEGYGCQEYWENFFKIVRQSPFLMGKNDRGWRATLSWLLGPKNFQKVINGEYTTNKKVSKWGLYD